MERKTMTMCLTGKSVSEKKKKLCLSEITQFNVL